MARPGDVVRTYWAMAEAQNWERLGAVLSENVEWTIPQTAEHSRGREQALAFHQAKPVERHLRIQRLLVDEGGRCVTWTSLTKDGTTSSRVTFFDVDSAGHITEIIDFRPEPYAAAPAAGRPGGASATP